MTTLDRGGFCISIDLELAWGVWDKLSDGYVQKCAELERTIVARLLDIFRRREVPVTWVTVSHLLVPRERTDGTPEEVWYAPDLVERIRKEPDQEIGSHSFAHVYYGQISRDAVAEDIGRARDTHAAHGLPFDTFVFPRNDIAHRDVVREAGIKVYRGLDHGWHKRAAGVSRRLGQAANFADKLLPVTSTVAPEQAAGMVELPSSMLFLGRNGPRRFVPPALVELKCRRALARAARTGSLFHLWFHPSNFYYETELQLQILDRVVAHAARLRDRDGLRIVPMGAFADVGA